MKVCVVWSSDGGETVQALAYNSGNGRPRVYEKDSVESRACDLRGAQPLFVKNGRELLAHIVNSAAPVQMPAHLVQRLFR